MAGRGTFAVDLTGQVFGRLTVLSRAGQNSMARAMWLCRCECGNECTVLGHNIRHGKTKSCGCFKKEGTWNTKHGHTAHGKKSRVYIAWKHMKLRCDNPKMQNYRYYGGRGITYDPAWKVFENFYADMGDPPDGYTLDRIDNLRGYSKENCRWATRLTQRHNRSDSGNIMWVDIHGEHLVLSKAVEKYGAVSLATVLKRLGRGWDVVAAIMAPVGTPQRLA